MNKDEVIQKLRAHEPELKAAGIVRLAVFGSVARGTICRNRTSGSEGGSLCLLTSPNGICGTLWRALKRQKRPSSTRLQIVAEAVIRLETAGREVYPDIDWKG